MDLSPPRDDKPAEDRKSTGQAGQDLKFLAKTRATNKVVAQRKATADELKKNLQRILLEAKAIVDAFNDIRRVLDLPLIPNSIISMSVSVNKFPDRVEHACDPKISLENRQALVSDLVEGLDEILEFIFQFLKFVSSEVKLNVERLRSCLKAKAELRRQLKSCLKEKTELESRIVELEQERNILKSIADTAECDFTTTTIDELQHEITRARSAAATAEAELDQYAWIVHQRDDEIERLEKKIENLEDTAKEFEKGVKNFIAGCTDDESSCDDSVSRHISNSSDSPGAR